jgi:threonine dehydrogenase-like Zn-dependent dehydrogenase
LIESGKYPLEKMHTHSFGLDGLEHALLTLAGRVPGKNAISVSINPEL